MDLWIFGYGSLVWRPDLPVAEAHPARLDGWQRRFWQGSPDHRGTAEAPGRVVTLIERPAEHTIGRVYRVAAEAVPEVLARLDHREQAGYQRIRRRVAVADHGDVEALVYFATEGNPSWLGPAPVPQMVRHIARARGRSGTNREYLLRLDEALDAMGAVDAHVRDLATAVRAQPVHAAVGGRP